MLTTPCVCRVDLMNPVYRAESDNSVDADEPIMKHMTEGGVTILKQLDRKKRVRRRKCLRHYVLLSVNQIQVYDVRDG